jgi:hypothetical protein
MADEIHMNTALEASSERVHADIVAMGSGPAGVYVAVAAADLDRGRWPEADEADQRLGRLMV